ncbi:DUF2254 family protein [uncultured Methanobacterium sp.]|uniref:DUF2254 family protein n=1 Tax=uncultured Methanobacterium sp. TaxID=176306 RepID=UPI002AA8C2B2|nr:DUF2254 family protein [uncultured Methanobacterium sp.]
MKYFNLTIRRIFFYLKTKKIIIGYLTVILLFLGILYYFPLFIQLNDFRSISSTIFQGLASILAIVIALTLVSVQIFSQNYSTRVLKIFFDIKNYALWVLMIMYLFAIIFSLLAPFYVEYNPNHLIMVFNFLIWITIASLLVLVPYLLYITRILQPEEVLKIIFSKINEDLISKVTKYKETPYVAGNFTDLRKFPSKDDPLIPFIEIIVGAIKNNHTETADEGLVLLGNIFLDFETNVINKKNGKPVLNYFLDHLEVVRDITIDYKDSKSLSKLHYIVFRIGFLISQKINNFTFLISFYQDIPNSCSCAEFELIRVHLISDFKRLLHELIERVNNNEIKNIYNIYSMNYSDLDRYLRDYKNSYEKMDNFFNIYKVLNLLNSFWVVSIENQLWNTRQNVQLALGNLIPKLINDGLFRQIKQEILSLRNISTYTINEYPELLDEVLSILSLTSDELCRIWIFNPLKTKNEVSNAKDLIINILETYVYIAHEALKKGNFDLKIGIYPYIEEIDSEKSIILILTENLNKIAFLFMDERINKSELSDDEIENLIMTIIQYNCNFGIDIAQKRSDSVIEIVSSLYSIAESSTNLSKVIRFKIGLEVFYSIRDITDEILINDSKGILDSAEYLTHLHDWAITNDFYIIKSFIIEYLGDISLKLTNKKFLSDDLKNIITILKNITLDNIKKRNKTDVAESLKQLKDLAEEMANKKFMKEELEFVSESISMIHKDLLTEGMHDILNDFDEWIKTFNKFYK